MRRACRELLNTGATTSRTGSAITSDPTPVVPRGLLIHCTPPEEMKRVTSRGKLSVLIVTTLLVMVALIIIDFWQAS